MPAIKERNWLHHPKNKQADTRQNFESSKRASFIFEKEGEKKNEKTKKKKTVIPAHEEMGLRPFVISHSPDTMLANTHLITFLRGAANT